MDNVFCHVFSFQIRTSLQYNLITHFKSHNFVGSTLITFYSISIYFFNENGFQNQLNCLSEWLYVYENIFQRYYSVKISEW